MPTDENKNVNETVEQKQDKPAPGSVDDFIKAAKEAKEDRVTRAEYDKVIEDNRKLMEALLEGKELDSEDDETPSTPDVAELKKVFRDPDATNLEIVSASLGIRKAVLESTGKDPFASKDEDAESAQKVADVFQQCVDEADGDSEKFVYLLKNRIYDDSALTAAMEKRRKANKKG